MRISDDRYSRDRLRLDVALRFIRLEARTQTIRAWTGLTDDRIRKLYRSYLAEAAPGLLTRHRGKSPQQPGFFIRTARARLESALFASLCRLAGALPPAAGPSGSPAAAGTPAARVPTLARAYLVCLAYETYRSLVPSPLISFEHAVFLFTSLARGDELALSRCHLCGALLVVDRWSLRAVRCAPCDGDPQRLAPPTSRGGTGEIEDVTAALLTSAE